MDYQIAPDRCTDYATFSGFSLFPGYHGLHCHNFFEFYIFFSGAPHYCIGDQIIPLKPCTLVIIPPFYMHGLIGEKSDSVYERAWLHATPAMIQTISMGLTDLSDFFRKCVRTGKVYFHIDQHRAEQLRGIIGSIQENRSDQSDIVKWQNDLRVANFFSAVYDIVHASDAVCEPVVLNETIQSILTYINDHFSEHISISELSRMFGISASYMTREFSAYTGRSIYDYVLYRRILLAKEMIYTDKSFTEISFECGFNDYSCFLRAFTRIAGQSPTAYKKNIRSIRSMV